MRLQWFVGLLILEIAALITTITSVTVAAISLTQQVHTAQFVDTMSKNVSLTLATQETINRKFRSDQIISHSVVSDSLRSHESQHARLLCPSPTPGVHSDSRPSSQ